MNEIDPPTCAAISSRSQRSQAEKPTPLVAAGVVNYRCARQTIRCARSLLQQTLPPARIAMIDNASGDGSVEALRREFAAEPRVCLIANDRNLGFAAAQNQAIRATQSEYYLTVNPDAFLKPDYVERLVQALADHPRAGYATGLIYYCDRDGRPTPYVFSAGHWWLRQRTALNRYIGLAWPEERLQSGEVGGASGCAPLYRRAMLESIDLGGGEYFDEMFFLYMEDIDLDWRGHLAGWTCWFEKSAVALHESEAAGGGMNPWIYGQLVSNRWLMVLKNDTLMNFLLHLPFFLKADICYYFPEMRRRPGAFSALFDGLCRRAREAWRKRRAARASAKLSPREIRAWMDDSLRDLRAANAFRLAHPELVRSRETAISK
ncbi:MAG: glycosyltransferase family 2 protein [Candidatus Sumerlaeota bacterium]|nr:glycosyltransferase family 2 protein [Candidatus Sumerlaeota bacterium]